MTRNELKLFVEESNRIEGIHRDPTAVEIMAHEDFLKLRDPTVHDLEVFVVTIAPGNRIRNAKGLDVRVGNHIPPRGGPDIFVDFMAIMTKATEGSESIFELHRDYETLHPFTDGNGRSGRVLWLWMMQNSGQIRMVESLGFLHSWYYQSLAATPKRS